MDEEVLRAQLEVIEEVYGIQFINKTEILQWILSTVHNEQEAYGITAALNTWVTLNNLSGPVRVPESWFTEIARSIEKKREYLH